MVYLFLEAHDSPLTTYTKPICTFLWLFKYAKPRRPFHSLHSRRRCHGFIILALHGSRSGLDEASILFAMASKLCFQITITG